MSSSFLLSLTDCRSHFLGAYGFRIRDTFKDKLESDSRVDFQCAALDDTVADISDEEEILGCSSLWVLDAHLGKFLCFFNICMHTEMYDAACMSMMFFKEIDEKMYIAVCVFMILSKKSDEEMYVAVGAFTMFFREKVVEVLEVQKCVRKAISSSVQEYVIVFVMDDR